MDKTTEAFEAWWADIGEQSLFALNTTTDDDIKILAGIAWEAAIRDVLAEHPMDYDQGFVDGVEAQLAEPVKQEPVAYFLDVKAECSSKPSYEQVPDEYKNDADVFPFYAAPVDAKAIRAEALEEAAKLCEAKQSYSAMHANTEFAAGIRGLK